MTDDNGSSSYGYDARGNLTSEARTLDGVTYSTGYSYDPAGQVEGITYDDGITVTPLAQNVQHKPFGPWQSLTHANGLVHDREFDSDYRLM